MLIQWSGWQALLSLTKAVFTHIGQSTHTVIASFIPIKQCQEGALNNATEIKANRKLLIIRIRRLPCLSDDSGRCKMQLSNWSIIMNVSQASQSAHFFNNSSSHKHCFLQIFCYITISSYFTLIKLRHFFSVLSMRQRAMIHETIFTMLISSGRSAVGSVCWGGFHRST